MTHWWITKHIEMDHVIEDRNFYAHGEEQAEAMIDLLLQEVEEEPGMAYYGKSQEDGTLSLTFKKMYPMKLVRITQSLCYTEEEWAKIDVAPPADFDRKAWTSILTFEE